MKIRSITYFCRVGAAHNPGWPLDIKMLQAAGAFLAEARAAFEAADYEVQTTRLATAPFPRMLGARKITETPRLAEMMAAAIKSTGIDYAALGPALPDFPYSYLVIPEAIAASQNVFFSGLMADAKSGISLSAVRACAEVICRCAPITPDGFANLRFAALANVPPGAPFFPAAYADGGEPAFAIATEAADLAVQAFSNAQTIEDGRRVMVADMQRHSRKIVAVADPLTRRFDLKFGGLDFSLAPFPEESRSLGAAMQRLGVPKVGLHGSLAAAAILTESIQRADFQRTGFSGLMLPVLEDAILSQRAAEGLLTIKDLLLYSAVCGSGLDTVPLPGDTAPEQIAALLLDLSALAMRLDKPLTARLMPIPGKKAGDPTGFDFAFFANSRVMALEAEALKPPLAGDEAFALLSR